MLRWKVSIAVACTILLSIFYLAIENHLSEQDLETDIEGPGRHHQQELSQGALDLLASTQSLRRGSQGCGSGLLAS